MAEHSLLDTTFPVLLPDMPELRLEKDEFQAAIKSLVHPPSTETRLSIRGSHSAAARPEGSKSTPQPSKTDSKDEKEAETKSPFMDALLSDKATVPSFDDRDGKMLTENADVAYKTSGEVLVDLFFELEDAIDRERLKTVLEKAWESDSQATLKIIWNARSIHLGKSSRVTFYRAVGWLAQNHPLTLLTNLPWLVRPIIRKKAEKKEEAVAKDAEMIDSKDAESDFEVIDEKGDEVQPDQKKRKLSEDDELAEFDVKYGVAHGYWKDLLNILALAAKDELKVDGDPRKVLNVSPAQSKKYRRDWTEGLKKTTNTARHESAVEKLRNDGFYKALHLTVARLFAEQLKIDLAHLETGEKLEKKQISLAAKWAPTHKGMHDQHTCIVSSIAELLYPFEVVCPKGVDPADRELYLKHARIAYQSQTLSPLRKHIDIVERYITEEKFHDIKYDRVPSLAMRQYTSLFAKKDYEHLDEYIEKVAVGKAKISGATLLPSTLVRLVLEGAQHKSPQTGNVGKMVQEKMEKIEFKAIDGQWNALVQRIKDSGTLSESIAVCDVSGSMTYPRFPDGTNPLCSSIGLSLLLAEVTKPPYGGAFITFSNQPRIMRVGGVGDERSFAEKVKYIERSNWQMNTDFAAVFEDLILPMAVRNNFTQDQMVKQVFVFSDMHFDAADSRESNWTSSFERIQKKYREAGYEMPRLVFWNLAGGAHGEAAPKPVNATEENMALVSGYSQGQMKMFLEGGGFEDGEEEEEIVEKEERGGETVVVVEKQKKKADPLAVVKKAIGHEAYRMLKVVD